MTDSTPGWIVLLTGQEIDLSLWERSLQSFDPWCERIPQGGNFVLALRSRSFDQAQSADEVRGHAILLIKQLNGALGLEAGAEPINYQSVGRIDDKGKTDLWSFPGTGHIRIRGAAPIVAVEETDVPPPPPEMSAVQKWVKAAESCKDIGIALNHFGQPTNWYDMWTTYEIIEDAIWNATPSCSRPKKDKKKRGKRQCPAKRILFMSRNWVSKGDFKKFAESCNYHRHGAKTQPKPHENASRDEAREILTRVLRAWLNEKVP